MHINLLTSFLPSLKYINIIHGGQNPGAGRARLHHIASGGIKNRQGREAGLRRGQSGVPDGKAGLPLTASHA